MRSHDFCSKRLVPAVLVLVFVVVGAEAWAKGCGRMELTLKVPTEVNSELGKLTIAPGTVNFCWADFAPHQEESEAEILEKAYLVSRFKLAKAVALGNLFLAPDTELSLPDVFGHGDEDFQILSGGTRKIGGVELVATRSLPILINAYERTKTGFALRSDGWMKVSGHLSDNVSLSGIEIQAGHPVGFSGPVTAVTQAKTGDLRLVLGTVDHESYFSGTKARVVLERGDQLVFLEKPSQWYFQVIPLATRVLFLGNTRVVAHGVLSYRESQGTLASFIPAEDFEVNGMKVSGVDKYIQAPVTVYDQGPVESVMPRVAQEVQGVKLGFSWDPVYFWPNGKLLHVAQTEDENFRNMVWNGKKVTSYRANLSFDDRGQLRLWQASQAKVEGSSQEFVGLFEVTEGKYQEVPTDSPIRKWYDWRGYNQELRDWLKK